MAVLTKELPHGNFFRTFNGIATAGLSHRALIVYLFLAEVPPHRDYSDNYLLKSLDMSVNTLALAKKELKQRDLLYIHRLGPKSYKMFLGYPKVPASEVARKNLTKQSSETNGD